MFSCIFHYSDDTTLRVHRLSVVKRLLLTDPHPKNRLCEFTTNDSWNRGSEQLLVARGPPQKEKLHLAILTRTRTHQDGRNIQLLSTEWQVQK